MQYERHIKEIEQKKYSELKLKDQELEKEKKDFELKIKDQELEKEKKDSEIKILRINLESKETELLRTRGLLTGRGIFEFYLLQAGFELKNEKATKGLDVTSVCTKIDEVIDKNITFPGNNMGYYTKKIYKLALKCRNSIKYPGDYVLTRLYRKLSNSIHGYPWYGPSVSIYAKDLEPNDKCILVAMCEEMRLSSYFTEEIH